jgi:hypothetical protein
MLTFQLRAGRVAGRSHTCQLRSVASGTAPREPRCRLNRSPVVRSPTPTTTHPDELPSLQPRSTRCNMGQARSSQNRITSQDRAILESVHVSFEDRLKEDHREKLRRSNIEGAGKAWGYVADSQFSFFLLLGLICI